MRGTIPKVMDSVLLHSVSPDQLHSNFSQAANAAAEAIKRFTQIVEDGKTREIIEKARERRTENSEGITGWQVAEHEDWLDVKQEDGKEEIDKEDEVVADASEGSSGKDMTAALDRFRSVHVGIEVSQDEDSKKMTVSHWHLFKRAVSKCVRSLYLCQPGSTFRFSPVPTPRAATFTALTAKANRDCTEQFLRQSEHELEHTTWTRSSYVRSQLLPCITC